MHVLHRLSKWLHKYIGLGLVVFLAWMSASGILLNHPALLRDLSVPGLLVPPQYRIANWSRGALRTAVFREANPEVGYVAGTQGVWKTNDGGLSFVELGDGFPRSYVDRQTDSVVLDEAGGRLFAGTRGGLYVCDLARESWEVVPLPVEEVRIRKVLRVGDELLVLTPSHVLRGRLAGPTIELKPTELRAKVEQAGTVPLIRAWFELHSGKIWGLAGRLMFDVAGLVVIFLCVSAVYIWYWPWKLRWAKRRGRRVAGANPRYHWFLKYHLRLGIWAAVLLLVIGGTGLFMRPPMIVALAGAELPRWLYPGRLPENPWHERIQNALYDAVNDMVLLETTDGFWRGPSSLAEPLEPVPAPGPVFVMGTTVLEPYGTGGYLVGSFSGLMHLERATGRAVDLIEGRAEAEVSRFRPAEVMAAGFLRLPDGDEFVAAHYRGLLPVGDAKLGGRFEMPAEMAREFRLPLWNFLLELHNGRIFRDLLGPAYALIVPVGSLLFILITVTGVFDWCYGRPRH